MRRSPSERFPSAHWPKVSSRGSRGLPWALFVIGPGRDASPVDERQPPDDLAAEQGRWRILGDVVHD